MELLRNHGKKQDSAGDYRKVNIVPDMSILRWILYRLAYKLCFWRKSGKPDALGSGLPPESRPGPSCTGIAYLISYYYYFKYEFLVLWERKI
eukprot:SAG11_NODE_1435_length_4914_cov_10.282866_1_plen_92_part_00